MLTNQRSVRRVFRASVLAAVCMAASAQVVAAQKASIAGTVLADSTEKALPNAEVLLTNLDRSTRTDSAGNFLFKDLPAGKHSVTVRLVGFGSYSADIVLKGSDKFEADFLLKPSMTKLAAVDVKAVAPFASKLAEFDERRKVGVGRYLTADYFEQQQGRPLSSFLAQKIPGLNVVQSGTGRRWLATSSRGINLRSRGDLGSGGLEKVPPGCYAQVIINGVVRYDGSPGQLLVDIDEMNSLDVIGFEFYTTATTPMQYNKTRSTSGCGTVIIWTK